jgi:hypothetical protein
MTPASEDPPNSKTAEQRESQFGERPDRPELSAGDQHGMSIIVHLYEKLYKRRTLIAGAARR